MIIKIKKLKYNGNISINIFYIFLLFKSQILSNNIIFINLYIYQLFIIINITSTYINLGSKMK